MSVRYEIDGDVAVITLNRPDHFNGINDELSRDMVEALGRAGAESRALVVTGSGKAFCPGADLGFMLERFDQPGGPDLGGFLDESFHPLVGALIDCRVPTVAALNGVAAGAGLGIALTCDLRVMAENAFLTSAFTAIGVAPDSGTTWWLPHYVGVSRALELAFTNRRVDAEEALRLGLCSQVVPNDDLLTVAKKTAASLADLETDSLIATRKLIRDAAGSSFGTALAAEREAQHRLGQSPRFREGVQAFMEKRKPDFRSA